MNAKQLIRALKLLDKAARINGGPSPEIYINDMSILQLREPDEVTLLRGPLSKRATSAEFNEWQAHEVVAYIDHLREALAANVGSTIHHIRIDRAVNNHPGQGVQTVIKLFQWEEHT